jgi:3-phenylpropionate/trans-cinnamate dioxygenase ferredoxin reductase subunit
MARPGQRTFLIAGASLAGASAAAGLRKEGFDGGIVLVGEEDERPYERPELSKKYLRAEIEADELYVHEAGFYEANGIEFRPSTRVQRIDRRAKRVELAAAGSNPGASAGSSADSIAYDRLLLTTGAAPRRLAIPGADLEGVVTLRRRGDSDAIRSAAREADRVVVIGGGWIGAEVAASLRQLGSEVALIAPHGAPMETVLGAEVATIYRDLHAEHGERLLMGTKARELRGEDRVEEVVTEDGRRLPADLVVVGIGVEPRTELAQAAGLDVDDGILVDERLRTSDPDVFAAGDLANALHPDLGTRLRVEHWDNAKRQGRHAARTMLDADAPYRRIPYFYSDQYDLGMEYTGYAPRWEEVVYRGDPARREFICFWLARGRVLAGMNVNVWDVAATIEKLVRAGAPVDRDRLTDPEVPLERLLPETEGA